MGWARLKLHKVPAASLWLWHAELSLVPGKGHYAGPSYEPCRKTLMSTTVLAHTCSALPVQARRRAATRSVAVRQPRPGTALCALAVRKPQAPAKEPASQRPQPSSASAKAAVLSHLLHFLPFWKEQDHVDSEDQSVSRELLIDTVEKAVEVGPPATKSPHCPPQHKHQLCFPSLSTLLMPVITWWQHPVIWSCCSTRLSGEVTQWC